jgi:hypothetical protein
MGFPSRSLQLCFAWGWTVTLMVKERKKEAVVVQSFSGTGCRLSRNNVDKHYLQL